MSTGTRLRMTTQRQVILEELRKLYSHPTAGELCAIVRQRLPRISLGTVYRNLEILSRQGLVTKLDIGGSEMRFDGRTDTHYHLRCLDCGKVEDLSLSPMSHLNEQVDSESHFEVTGHRLEFVGHCPQCQAEAAAG